MRDFSVDCLVLEVNNMKMLERGEKIGGNKEVIFLNTKNYSEMKKLEQNSREN